MAAAVVIAGCGSGESTETSPPVPVEPTEIDLTLDGYSGPATAGIVIAEERGYFDELGVNVWVRTPASKLNPLRYVVEKEVALAVTHQPQVVLAQAKGAPVVAFGSLIPDPTAAMIWLKDSKIEDVGDLKGKTIAFTGLPFEREFLGVVLAGAGLTFDDVKLERADYELVSALASGRAGAIFGASSVEGAELEARGLEPVITPGESLGLPGYEELVLIARPERLAKEPEVIERFMEALARGTAEAIEDPKAAAHAIEESYGADTALSPKATEAAVQATVPLLSTDGEMDADQAEGLVDWMQEEGMIEQAMPASDLLTNDYLASP